MDLTITGYVYVGLAAFLVGFTKTSVGGVGILAVLLMALAFPGKASPGVLLPMLLAADVMAVIYYRRDCQWDVLLKLFPLTLAGVGLGVLVLYGVPDYSFSRIIGWIILSMLALDLALSEGVRKHLRGPGFTWFSGLFAGAASMVANAAGPVFGIYLLQAGLGKSEFVGTRSWFFLVLNLAKIPFSLGLGLITTQSLILDLTYLPVILAGAVVGNRVLKFINIGLFKTLIRMAVLFSAVRLVIF
jgi:uncharacterized membrane protein YfcA